jgi:hypothetical protein
MGPLERLVPREEGMRGHKRVLLRTHFWMSSKERETKGVCPEFSEAVELLGTWK